MYRSASTTESSGFAGVGLRCRRFETAGTSAGAVASESEFSSAFDAGVAAVCAGCAPKSDDGFADPVGCNAAVGVDCESVCEPVCGEEAFATGAAPPSAEAAGGPTESLLAAAGVAVEVCAAGCGVTALAASGVVPLPAVLSVLAVCSADAGFLLVR